MVFNATLNTIAVILVQETGENRHRPGIDHRQTLSYKCCIEYTSPRVGFELSTLAVIDTDCTGSCKSNYHYGMVRS